MNNVPKFCEGPDILICHKLFVAEFAKEAIRLSPYDVPENLETALRKVAEATRDYFYPDKDSSGFKKVSRIWLYNKAKELVISIPEVSAWNNRKNGRDGIGIITRFFNPKKDPDDNFVDLGALAGNFTRGVIVTCIEQEHMISRISEAARNNDYKSREFGEM